MLKRRGNGEGRSTRLPGPGSIGGGRGWTRSGRVVELVCLGLGLFLGANITGVLWAYYWAVLRPMMDQLLVRYSDCLVLKLSRIIGNKARVLVMGRVCYRVDQSTCKNTRRIKSYTFFLYKIKNAKRLFGDIR